MIRLKMIRLKMINLQNIWVRIMLTRVVILVLYLTHTLASAHTLTFSQVDLRFSPNITQITVRLPVAALEQEKSSLLQGITGDQLLKQTDSQRLQVALLEWLKSRLKLTDSSTASRVVLPLTLTRIESETNLGNIHLELTAPTPKGDLTISANLFPQDALHKIFLNLYQQDTKIQKVGFQKAGSGYTLFGQWALDRQSNPVKYAAQPRPLNEVFWVFLLEGIHHIFIGADHILFVLSLLLLGGTVIVQLKVITTFTLAHTITLVLATLGLLSPPSRLIESIIALSIVLVGLHNLWQLRQKSVLPAQDPRILFSFGFGLVHGFGFASVLQELSLPKEALFASLAAFNIGVEVGQVTIVLLATPILWALHKYAPPLLTRRVLMGASSVTVMIASIWLVQRMMA